MRYLKFIPALLLCGMAASCNSYQKLYEAQEYDQLIQNLSPKICDGDLNPKHINWVAASYHKANQADHDRIQELKALGQPDAWPEIYQRYSSMAGRYEALSCLPAQLKKDINYVPLNLNEEMTMARNKAEAYLMAKINQLLATRNPDDAAEAESYILQLRRTVPSNSHIMEYRRAAMLRQAEKVLVSFDNDKELSLPRGFAGELLAFEANTLPANLSNFEERGKRYDVCVYVVLKDAVCKPDHLDKVSFSETNNGKKAQVSDYTMTKSATISGVVEFYDNSLKRVRFSYPFEVTSDFNYQYTTMEGDREACSQETLTKLENPTLPFPTDESLLLDAAKKLNGLVAAELRR